MSYTVSNYPHGTFSWADVASTDFPKTKDFLTQLFNWTSQDMPTGPNTPDYTMFYRDGKVTAGGAPTFAPDMPSFWSNYVKVDNIDEITAKAEQLGGKVTMPTMDVLDSGRMAVIQDPTGANLGLWQPKNFQGAEVVNTVGTMSWNELYTKDVPKAKQFYTDLFNWKYTEQENYTTILNNERMNGGIFQITENMPMPPCWMVYFTVANLAESVKKVTELGGQVWMAEKEISVGKIATISDPTGAGMILIEMNVEPEHWQE